MILSTCVTYTVDVSTVHAICPHCNNNIFLIIIINNCGKIYIILYYVCIRLTLKYLLCEVILKSYLIITIISMIKRAIYNAVGSS